MQKVNSKEKFLSEIKFDEKGLVGAIVQNYQNNQILMFAFMNKQAIIKTIETGFAHYFSRSRNKLWKKGETSGQTQKIQEILLDCDGDCLILKIEQNGVACHSGTKSCFYKTLDENLSWQRNQQILISNEELYGKKQD